MDSASDSKSLPKTRKKRSKPTSSPRKTEPDSRRYHGVIQPKGFPGLPESWGSEWETFPSTDESLKLFGVMHGKINPVTGELGGPRVLFIVHGLWEHGGRYFHFPHYLHGAVDGVYCLDQRGHGRSEGLRGHIERFDHFVEDVAHAVQRLDGQLKKRFGSSEIHLLGHSMGGLVSLRTLIAHPELPLASATLSAPLLGIRADVPWLKKLAAVALARIWGSLQMAAELNPEHLSRDPRVIEAHLLDRLIHQKITPRLFMEMTAAIEATAPHKKGVVRPLQVLLPLEDRVTDSQVALEFFQRLAHEQKVIKTYPGFFHEPFNEQDKEIPFEDLRKWIIAHSSSD